MKKTHPLKIRSVWISDIHLGYRGCQAQHLIDFLHSVECEYLYLVGDIIDFWSLDKSPYWPQAHTNVVRSILGKAKRGTKVIYIPGNHDEIMREYSGYSFGNVEIHHDYTHITADGKQLLVVHGDEFDMIVKHNKFITKLGTSAYDALLILNRYINIFRKILNKNNWSLAKQIKLKVKKANNYINCFRQTLINVASERNVDGVICGHIHHEEIYHNDDMHYYNDGDWVESCSSLIEHADGRMEIIHWKPNSIEAITDETDGDYNRAA